MDSDSPGPDEVDRLRAERDEWRRRAEVAEAIAAERLARAETAERALTAAEAALHSLGQVPPRAATTGDQPPSAADAPEPVPPRPRSLIERWRRYTDTIN
ncbi:MAG TPA: hypothetical protein VHT97_11745 [Acidimicrobiales bacterium]|nr:hypothetical protein [Acidimicrobiales bacterium]